VVSSNDQCYPVQIIASLDESRLDLVARSKAVLGPFWFVSFCRMKPVHGGPFTSEKCHGFAFADGAQAEAAAAQSRGFRCHRRPMRQQVSDKLQIFSSGVPPDGRQTSAGFVGSWYPAIVDCSD
jgi:hypothetical protein